MKAPLPPPSRTALLPGRDCSSPPRPRAVSSTIGEAPGAALSSTVAYSLEFANGYVQSEVIEVCGNSDATGLQPHRHPSQVKLSSPQVSSSQPSCKKYETLGKFRTIFSVSRLKLYFTCPRRGIVRTRGKCQR